MIESEAVRYIKHINDCLKKRANNSLRKEGLTLMLPCFIEITGNT